MDLALCSIINAADQWWHKSLRNSDGMLTQDPATSAAFTFISALEPPPQDSLDFQEEEIQDATSAAHANQADPASSGNVLHVLVSGRWVAIPL